MKDRAALLEESPAAVTQSLALNFLERAARAAELVESNTGAEALHDFRVALRRLRSLLKDYRRLLREGIPSKQARAIRDIARSTGVARDAEVQLEWLTTQREELDSDARDALSWMVKKLEERRQTAYAAVRGNVLRRFAELEKKLRRGLSRCKSTVGPGTAPATFALAAAEMVRRAGTKLVRTLEAVRAPTDAEEAHRARIQAKRLRYLLEPLHGTALEQPAGRLVSSAKVLQEVLGNLHDMHVMAAEIESSLVETATEHARTLHEALYVTGPTSPGRDLRSGILAIDRRVRDRAEAVFQELRVLWTAEQLEMFHAEVEALAAALRHHGGNDSGIERRFLLASLPAIKAPPMDITQGWIPGNIIQLCLEKVVSGGEERLYRTVKNGSGASRTELEEGKNRDAFERLWSLTGGRQLRKRRYRIVEGERVWEVDEFLDRQLVIAATSQNGSHEENGFPGWLGPHIEREVTGEARYVDENLAR
jgi:CHAD domain-containing protein/CYTH domain-containing protein